MDQLDLLGDAEQQAVVRHVARCRACKRRLRDPESLGFFIGPTCRRRLGIEPGRRLRITGLPRGWEIDGQVDLLQEGDG
ncbi:DUF6011 domain-containing protein [Nonomuraea soli]|uniref:Uncharacterized protein n=1 Tax=Nonomuraea soli TaxID=1032476 RepID=A0A7W0CSW8_9ACTN|nr:DUF6011 domain-containing protein [Nonomuraea soli]MBA2896622.1 hypothetical protein [Nonomuraea soli]